jgi:nucleoside-diphosphate-sugar epimerase
MKIGEHMAHGRRVMLTGASGYLGSLIAASLLRHESVTILAPTRGGDRDSVVAPLRAELAADGIEFDDAFRDRIEVVALPPIEDLNRLEPVMRTFGVDEVVHCAACLDYFDRTKLQAVNVELTRRLLQHSAAVGVERFIHISTAYSSGYTETVVPERLHAEPASDPTDYTRTKRAAEWLVANSGMPFAILRPSIVIGDSRDGRYRGKRYGLYQLWSALERLICREWHAEIHTYAPHQPVNLVHQDAFQDAFRLAYRFLPANSILNIVSDEGVAPTAHELWELWMNACNRPDRMHYYDRMSDIPMRSIPAAQRALLALASVNLEIIGHSWRFETTGLDELRRIGLQMRDTTIDSVELCQRRFIAQSEAIQRFLSRLPQRVAQPSVAHP